MLIIYEHDLDLLILSCSISTHLTEAGGLVQETRIHYRVDDITAWTIIFFQIFSSYVFGSILKLLKN